MNQHNSTADETLQHNVDLYDDYYNKPGWWFRFRYDTQVKRKTCLYLLRMAGMDLAHKRVLEIGFGSGAVLFSFDKSCQVYGLEISQSAIAQAERKAAKLGYKEYGFRHVFDDILPYPDDHFDVIIASHVVEHVQDDAKLLREIRRALKPEGVAVVLIPINENYHDPNHLHRYDTPGFLRLAQESSLIAISQIENELLFHFVEKFYFEEYNRRWNVFGSLIAALFNFPTAILPFWVYRTIEAVMLVLGWKPRQLGCVLVHA
jgi:ubiquinone/menaquinone biosynthesis C-methylase UbiE